MKNPADQGAPLPSTVCSNGERVLYHYSNYYGLTGIVSSKAIWCSQIQYLNDSGELRHGLDILAGVAKKYAKDVPSLDNIATRTGQFYSVNVFVCSFSEAGDTLSQWRGYSGGSGVSIAFSFEKLNEKAALYGYSLNKCIYDNKEKISIAERYVEEYIKANSDCLTDDNFSSKIVSNFVPIAALFKDRGFAEEQEWRLISPLTSSAEGIIKTRPTATGLIPYTVFDLKTGVFPFLSKSQPWRSEEHICIEEVVVGPNHEKKLQVSSVHTLFDSHHAAKPIVKSSLIPFRII